MEGQAGDRKLRVEVARDPDVPQGRAADHQDGAARARTTPGDAHGGQVPQARRGVLLPLRDPRPARARSGRFQTAPAADSRAAGEDRLLLLPGLAGRATSARTGPSPREDADLVVCLGDYIYERNFYDGPRKDTLGANRDGEVQTLAEYRAKYRHVQDRPRPAGHARRSTRSWRIWDDHEVEDNYAGVQPRRGDPAGARAVPEPQGQRLPRLLRVHAVRAAVRPARGGQRPVPAHAPGRATSSCSCSTSASTATTSPAATRSSPPAPRPRTSRGGSWATARRSWLKRRLRASGASWKLIGNQLMIMSLDAGPGRADQQGLLGRLRRRAARDPRLRRAPRASATSAS